MLAQAAEAVKEVTNAQLMDKIDTLLSLASWLYVLVGVVAVYLGWTLRRLARNQVDLAELIGKALAPGEGKGEKP